MNRSILILALSALAALACSRDRREHAQPGAVSDPLAAAASYVGAAVCRECHAAEYGAWKGSHHERAMDHAAAETVRGDFNNTTFSYYGITSRFYQRDGKFYVRTDGADGSLQEFEIAYTFGYYPLQQYLVAFPGGRYQALSLAWDCRPKEQGGQRWFHMHPEEAIRAGDELHWTGPAMNWNFMCADCHSTRLRKNYDATARTFATDWSEINVACEACHGAGSVHVEWGRKQEEGANVDRYTAMGLQVRLRDPAAGVWTMAPGAATAARSAPWRADAEVETCGRCHARATRVRDDYLHGRPLMDTHLPVELRDGLYYADGQIEDEVYEYASFRQSRMYHKGVACHDCHDPHTLELRAPRDQVCAQCHAGASFATRAHHFHREDGPGASCIACHMPRHTYMVIDPRYDHSMRVPRPDLAMRIGAPDACTTPCHEDKPATWAAGAAKAWWPDLVSRPQYGDALHAGRVGAPGARDALVALAADMDRPAVARATAVSLLGGDASEAAHAALRLAAADADPMLRRAALESAGRLSPEQGREIAAPLLDDPVRTVRAEAGRVLAPLRGGADAAARAEIDAALEEYVAMQEANADRAFSHVNLGLLRITLGDPDGAESHYRTAIELEPRYVPAYVNLADLYRALDRDADGLAVLQRGVARYPQAAELHRALALVYTRLGRKGDALASIERAARLAPRDAGVAYVYALALHDAGRGPDAVSVLERSLAAEPYHRESLYALALFREERGQREGALEAARRLAALEPDDQTVRALLAQLQSGR